MPLRLRRERWVYSSRLWSYRTCTIFRRSSQPSRRAGRRDSYSCLLHHFGSAGARLGDLVLKARLPAISAFRDLAIAGLLMTYGPNVEELFGRSARDRGTANVAASHWLAVYGTASVYQLFPSGPPGSRLCRGSERGN